MFLKIIIYTLGIILAIPVLLWFAIRELIKGSWHLLGFICQHHYRELKRLCEQGTADELKAFLAANPGAREYIVYSCQDKITSSIIALFRLPAPLAVAGRANNLPVISVLLANGASPEIRSVSAKQTPAEEAIGEPERMRELCGGKTWWLECSVKPDALVAGIKEGNYCGIIWNILRGARVEKTEILYSLGFLKLPMVMKEFVCRFGVDESRRMVFLKWLQENPATREHVEQTFRRSGRGMEKEVAKRLKELSEVSVAMNKSAQPLPSVDDDAVEKLMYSVNLL